MRFGHRLLDSTAVTFDSLSVLPGSLSISGLDSSDYTFDFATSTLYLRNPARLGQTVSYTYRVLPYNITKPVAHKSPELVLPRFVDDPTSHDLSLITTTPPPNSIFDSDLQGNGSISRSIAVGNRQDFVLNAHLNLQLSGTLAPDLEILANITDENIPIQPEGNTRYLRDFNKVFIHLKYKDLLQVSAGDVELGAPDSTFLFRLRRQFTGLKAQAVTHAGDHSTFSNMVGGGITKGKFVRNAIIPIHGVQGPYQLTGEQGETNIVVLSGSERVFLDGVLLTRGQDNDYVIDYNTGELTFTTKHLITEHNRIILTFEYSDQYYTRYNLFTYNSFTHEKNSRIVLDVNLFHEQDLKGQSIRPELTDDQMLFLAGIGDQSALANYSGAAPVADHLAGEVLYLRVDTLVEGHHYAPVYVYAGNARDSLYRVSFSYVGAGRGNYVLSQSTVNGKVYRWVAPVGGVPQGDYDPVVPLNAPKMNDLLSVGATFHVSGKLKVRTEWVFSYADANLFSKKDDRDNAGLANKTVVEYKTRVRGRHPDSLWHYAVRLDYEFVHKNYMPLSSFREVEFFRDFNLASDYTTESSEQILKFSTGFLHPTCGATNYTFDWLARFGNLHALRHKITSAHRFRGWSWNAATSFLSSDDTIQRTRFLKSNNLIRRDFTHVYLALRDDLEYNVFRTASMGQLRANSYAFNEAAFTFGSSDTARVAYSLQYLNRLDYLPLDESQLTLHTLAHEAKVSLECLQWKYNRLKISAVYRNDNVRDSSQRFHADHNFVGSLDYYGSFWKGAVTLNLYYEAGSGLEQKREYTFLKVAAGQGTHVWNDYNGNGIEELEEFERAVFQNEADYVKVWLPTNEYVNTRNCGTTQSLQLRPANVWRNSHGFRKFLSMFANTTMLRTYQKNTLRRDVRAFNPFQFNLNDTVLVSQTANFKNSVSLLLPKSYLSIDYTYSYGQSKNLLYYGIESAKSASHLVSLRSVPHKLLILKTIYTRAMGTNTTDCFDTRNHQILSHKLEQALTFNIENVASVTASCIMTYKRNLMALEKSNLYLVSLSGDYRMKERGALSASVQYARILYNQTGESAIAYEMLEGLTAGNNFLWNVTFQTKLFEYLQLNLQYEGRVTNDNRLIHTGFLQLKALF